MNQIQQNKLNMYVAVQKTLSGQSTLWSDIVAISDAVTELNDLISLIRVMGAQRAVSTTGLTLTKAEKKKQMAEKALALGGLAFAYATKEKDQKLIAIFDYSLSDLNSVADNTAIDRCTAIHNEIIKLLPLLNGYNITEAEIAELFTAVDVFKEAIGEKGSTKGKGVASTKTLASLFKDGNSLLKNRLDKLIFRFKDNELAFFNAYTNARTPLSLGGGKTKKEKPATPPAK